jgi:recombination protein RecA
VQHGLIEKSGSWYSYKGERIGQGRDTARQALIDRREFCQTVETELRRSLGLGENGQKMPPDFELQRPSQPRQVSASS